MVVAPTQQYSIARLNSQARTVTGDINFPCSADHEQDWQPYPVDSAICDDHTYIHTYRGVTHNAVHLHINCHAGKRNKSKNPP